MAKFTAKLEIGLVIELDDEEFEDEDEMLEEARNAFHEMRIREYIHAIDATMIGLVDVHGVPVGAHDVTWEIPERIDTDDLQIDD